MRESWLVLYARFLWLLSLVILRGNAEDFASFYEMWVEIVEIVHLLWTPLMMMIMAIVMTMIMMMMFLAVFGHSHVRGATTLNFGPISTKLGGIVRVIKKMTQKDNGPGPGRNYGETGVFTFGRKVVFGLKMGLTPKNHAGLINNW